jgi:hypothetical protein
VVGGGIVSGPLGALICSLAETVAGVRVEQAAHAAHLPLLGAALGVPDRPPAALVYDFGGTSLKRACAGYGYQAGSLDRLRLLPALPALSPGARGQDAILALAEAMTARITADWTQLTRTGLELSPVVGCAVNAYVGAEQPTDPYSAARALDGGSDWLSDAVSRRLGRPIQVTLTHDGTAAARCLAGEQDVAVLLLGTYLGVGFPPSGRPGRMLSPALEVG